MLLWVEKSKLKKQRDEERSIRRKGVIQSIWGGIRMKELCLKALCSEEIKQILFFDDIVDKDAAVTPDLEKIKVMRLKKLIWERKKLLMLKVEKLKNGCWRLLKVLLDRVLLLPRILNFEDEAEVENLVHTNSSSTAQSMGTDPKDNGKGDMGLKNLKSRNLTLHTNRAWKLQMMRKVARKIQAEWDARR
ncbi:hypothetical protein Tco_0392932 [Tanacetum coccineum]